jgi:hypothetical protein
MLAGNTYHEHNGELGERLVFRYLQQELLSQPGTTAEWLNEEQEQGLPYDIIVTTIDGTQATRYIEVKATVQPAVSSASTRFPISAYEAREAVARGSQYELWCVCGVSNEPKAWKIVDPANRFNKLANGAAANDTEYLIGLTIDLVPNPDFQLIGA